MPFLGKIVDGINNQWKISLGENAAFYGIAETIIDVRFAEANDEEILVRFPAIVDDFGEAKMIDINDAFPMIVYHKLDSIVNSETKTGFGDKKQQLEIANLSAIVFAFRRKVKKQAYQLEALMKDSVKTVEFKRNEEKLQQSSIHFQTSSFDKIALISREFSEIQLDYPSLICFDMKYQIRSTWVPGCASCE